MKQIKKVLRQRAQLVVGARSGAVCSFLLLRGGGTGGIVRREHFGDTAGDVARSVGFGNVVDRAQLDRAAPEPRLQVAREQENLGLVPAWILADETRQFEPVDFGHHEIGQNQVDLGFSQNFERFGAVRGGYRFIARTRQTELQRADDVGFIIHNQDLVTLQRSPPCIFFHAFHG
jgi:hypothetical protein